MSTPASRWLAGVFVRGIPEPPLRSVVTWGERFVRLPGSAIADRFSGSMTPWVRDPIECSGDGFTKIDTFVKPVQSGGSTAGEVVLCHRLATSSHGDVQYNWQHDIKASERWLKRVEAILLACSPLMDRKPADRNKWQRGLVIWPHLNLTVQGVFTDANVASDSIRTQINEEIHDKAGWLPGRLQQAYNRTTAYWDSFVMNISNAGYVGDQLHEAFLSGTQQHWTVKCPGCGLYHAPRTEWDPRHPELGGLRYDSEGCKRDDGSYDYNRLEPTIRLQMPCGYPVREDRREREALSASGKYSEPTNTGAHLSNRSFTLEAVSVHYIPFLKLIQEKHTALKAMKYGDPQKYCDYVRERECRFWDPNDRPLVGRITISRALKKTREGLRSHKGFAGRFFALDRQQGSLRKGETPHWWLAIRDAAREDLRLRTQLVFEGKIETDDNVLQVLDSHECIRCLGCADSGHDTMHVYQFCYRSGINCIKGGNADFYSHPKIGKRIYSPEEPLHAMINAPPRFAYARSGHRLVPHPDEPLFGSTAKWESASGSIGCGPRRS